MEPSCSIHWIHRSSPRHTTLYTVASDQFDLLKPVKSNNLYFMNNPTPKCANHTSDYLGLHLIGGVMCGVVWKEVHGCGS